MTGWTWDYARNNMTFKRYEAMKKYWREIPPLPVTAFVLARAFGMKTESPDAAQESALSGDIFYDESYYENTAETPWRTEAAGVLSKDFQAAGGEVKR